MRPKYGDIVTLEITHIDKKGRGCGKHEGRLFATPFALPGETVEVTVRKRGKGVFTCDLNEVMTPSPNRIKPKCSFAGKCGGCAWQHSSYESQLEMKRNYLNASMENHEVELTYDTIQPCPELFYFRNRMDYCVGWEGQIGLKQPGRWNGYLDITDCHLLSEDAVKILDIVRDYMKKHDVAPWDNKHHTGFMRYVVIREGKRTGKRMITLVTALGEFPDEQELVDVLSPFATTIYQGINPTLTDISYSHELKLLHGDELLVEEVDGKEYVIHPNSFFQTNTIMAEKLLLRVKELIAETNTKTLLDLYCGVGFMGLGVSDVVERVIGIELEPSAIVMAKQNAERNNITNTEFHAMKAEDFAWEDLAPDTVIIDPPRVGLHPKIIATLLEKKPERIVYVSCNHEAFAREWKVLSEVYDLKSSSAHDLFPHTPHVEIVSLLERK